MATSRTDGELGELRCHPRVTRWPDNRLRVLSFHKPLQAVERQELREESGDHRS